MDLMIEINEVDGLDVVALFARCLLGYSIT